MTSRARRIVLAMYGHQKPRRAEFDAYECLMTGLRFSHGCYDAMDEPDEIPLPVIAPGNYGHPHA